MTTYLPDGAWRHQDGLARLVATLGRDHVRIVGGAVRDTLMGLPVSDIDLASDLTPDVVTDILEKAGYTVIPTGLKHGTVTAVTEGGNVEITTLRLDVATDGRHAEVAYTTDWREDAARRDFTINGLYADAVSGEVFDWFGGLEDLSDRRVRFIGDPYARIDEDHLRILRFFRFHARFGQVMDQPSLAACAARAGTLERISAERIRDEMLKTLKANGEGAFTVIATMVENGILDAVIPEIRQDGVERLVLLAAREMAADVPGNALRRMAALLPRDADAVEAVTRRLKMSNEERARVIAAVAPMGDMREMTYRDGRDAAIDRLLLSDRPVAELAQIADWVPPALPVKGGELVEMGLSKGPGVSAALRRVEDRWIAEGYPERERALEMAREEVGLTA